MADSEADGTYDFPDVKSSGKVLVTMKWEDGSNNDERPVPDVYISTKKPYNQSSEPTIAKYAVAIYGICVDDVKDEATGSITKGGLTFGPALGANYVQSYKNHTPSGQTTAGNAHRCVHDDDWDEIIAWNKTDPYVYEDCIVNGCTHSVPLSKNTTSTIFSSIFQPTTETGDGPSALYYELVTGTNADCFENLRWRSNGGIYGTNSGGWGTTRIRAMLNGADELTDIGDSNYSSSASSDINKSASIYTVENCLFAAFPQNLRNTIGTRAVKYDSVYYLKTEANLKTTYDKLWLFSSNELADYASKNWENHPLEGTVYPKLAGSRDAYDSNFTRDPYRVDSNSGNNAGNTSVVWLRSSEGESHDNFALCLTSMGNVGSDFTWYNHGVSAGFTLAR